MLAKILSFARRTPGRAGKQQVPVYTLIPGVEQTFADGVRRSTMMNLFQLSVTAWILPMKISHFRIYKKLLEKVQFLTLCDI